MTLASLSLVVLASFIHASWNLLAKRAAAVGPVFVFAYNLIACIAYAPWVIWLLAQGGIDWTRAGIGFVLLSGLIHMGYSLCLQRAIRSPTCRWSTRWRGAPGRCCRPSALS